MTYFAMFEPISKDIFETAIKKLLIDWKKKSFPTIADIREAITGTLDERAEYSWSLVIYAMKTASAYNVKFTDKVIMQAIENLGGWRWLNNRDDQSLMFIRDRFLKAYKNLFWLRKAINIDVLYGQYGRGKLYVFESLGCKPKVITEPKRLPAVENVVTDRKTGLRKIREIMQRIFECKQEG